MSAAISGPSTPNEDKLEGADAMHAWVLVGCGEEVGWCGLDPTNGIFAGDDHVVLAIGRDYADVAPIDGVIYRVRRPAPRSVGERDAGGVGRRDAPRLRQRHRPRSRRAA